MNKQLDLKKEMKLNEKDFLKELGYLSEYNRVALAIIDSLQNDNFNGIIFNNGYDENKNFYIELLNLICPTEKLAYKLGRISPKNAEKYKIGTLINLHWEPNRSNPIINTNFSKSKYSLSMFIQLINCYEEIYATINSKNEYIALSSICNTITDALDNYFYNLEFNCTDFNLELENYIANMIKFKLRANETEIYNYCDYVNLGLKNIINSLKQNKAEEIDFSKIKYNPTFDIVITDFKKDIQNTSLNYLNDRIIKSISDRWKQKRFDIRLQNDFCKDLLFPKLLMRNGKKLSYLVISECERKIDYNKKEKYLHVVCLDSFSRDFFIKTKAINFDTSDFKPGSLFNAELLYIKNTEPSFINVEKLGDFSKENRLKNIMRLYKLVDFQKLSKLNTEFDLEDLREQQEYIIFTLKQFCLENCDTKQKSLITCRVQTTPEENNFVYNQILEIAKDSIANSSLNEKLFINY